jgi:hypothetical protein
MIADKQFKEKKGEGWKDGLMQLEYWNDGRMEY